MKFKFMDPAMIMSVIIALIILAVGIFAFFITLDNIPVTTGSSATTFDNKTYNAILNVSDTGASVFNIIGVVLVIGAIMTIIGLVYSYMAPRRY